MIDKKELRTELFKHIDGIALTAPISGLFSKHNDIFDSLKSTNKKYLRTSKSNQT